MNQDILTQKAQATRDVAVFRRWPLSHVLSLKCIKNPQLLFWLALIWTVLTLPACSLQEINRQSNALASTGMISGEVVVQGEVSDPIYVQLYSRDNGVIKLIDKNTLQPNGRYLFAVLPGTYSMATFIDSDADGEYLAGHWATYYGQTEIEPASVVIEADEEVEVPLLVIQGPITLPVRSDVMAQLGKHTENIGRVVSLDDAMFGRDVASMGLWRPLDFVEQVGGGLLLLQEYDKNKIPLLLVHGMGGTSAEFAEIVTSIDHHKYQPWVLYYPSGANLDLISDYMLEALQQLSHKYQFKQLGIIAHSMGGLMIRSYVMKQQLSESPYALKFMVTINSPLYGMESAASGVKNSPIVIQAWVDVARDSAYVKRVHSWAWPDSIPYHLVFSYLPGEDGDGVVPLNSQLSQSLQREASQIHGFEAQHAEILKQPIFLDKLNEILDGF
ncbi:MAG: alpha/beta hydrolase [Moritella sp.]|uniref:esterase/lipase family protein n=1 Tax=Moritella sp. TaxID=78556 RepID=UPI0029A2B885|nr:alpha/beta hydrolase [Moritella sp.]MDX2319573.1 alpha/beta hydrolase [Moritella sp.]